MQSRHRLLLFFIAVILFLSACANNQKSIRSSLSRFAAPATLGFARNIFEEAHFDIPGNGNWVALTIDDAPNSIATEKILQVLADSPDQPHATFFVVGEYAANKPELLQAIKDGEHELGNHSYTNSATAQLSLTEFVSSVERTNSVLTDYLNENDPKWFRPANTGYTSHQAGYLQDVGGYEIALGNADPYNFDDNNVPAAVRHIKRFVGPGAIIVLHDGAENGLRTVEILQQILPWLRDEGYSVKTLSELFANHQ